MDSNLIPLGLLHGAVYLHLSVHVCVPSCVCLCICEFVHLDYPELENGPLITFIFSCNLKAITISLGVRKSVNMVHLFDGEGRTDKSSSSASICNCY